jgi:two-component system sensor histidine kinase UhpB
MPLRRRLLLFTSLVLALCLVAAGALTYWQGLRKVELEMTSAIEVANSAVGDAVSAAGGNLATPAYLRRIVRSFDGDRHIVARLLDSNGNVVAVSRLRRPPDAAPSWLNWLLAGKAHISHFQLPDKFEGFGSIVIETDPHNEISEVWEDLKLKTFIVLLFCGVVLALIYATLGRALRPLEDLSEALQRIGHGDYSAQVAETGPEELNLIYRAFNRMADQLRSAEEQNQRLNQQLSTVQEEERAEIARDLHDEIGPFLFATDVDAQSIPLLLSRQAHDDAVQRAGAIRQSVQHMQLHLRGILSRLRPAMLIDQGLPIAVEQLVAFWRARKPQITFEMDIEDQRYPERLEETAFRLLQEGTSNAVRHGKPSQIGLSVKKTEDGKMRIVISDDGSGLAVTGRRGFGLAGMRERVTSLDGTLNVVSGKDTEKGVVLIAEIPLSCDEQAKPKERENASAV